MRYVAFVRYDYVASERSKLAMYGANESRQINGVIDAIFSRAEATDLQRQAAEFPLWPAGNGR